METPAASRQLWTVALSDSIQAIARESGFDLAGIAEVRDPHHPEAAADAARFAAWIDSGRAGEMDYLKRRDPSGTLLRANLRSAMPWARSVLVCAMNYNAGGPRSIDPTPAAAGWIARYAWSGRTAPGGATLPTDYHDELLTRLRRIESALNERAECTTRCYVDTGPILERSIAAQAGVGWIGKNTCVLNQQLGSWLLLGVLVTSLEVAPSALAIPAPDRCGSCTSCIDACPTGALLASSAPASPREMDASLCIAYLTIEKKGAIPAALRAPVGRQVFGCDICQDVCPWNRRAPIASAREGMFPRPELVNPALDWLASMDAKEFKRRFKGSPLERTGRKRLLRNVAIAMGNSGDRRFLPQLEAWATASTDPTPTGIDLRESAAWACAKLLPGQEPPPVSETGLSR